MIVSSGPGPGRAPVWCLMDGLMQRGVSLQGVEEIKECN